MKIYLATPIEGAARSKQEYLEYAEKIAEELEAEGNEVYRPWKMHIDNAWDLPNDVWGDEVAKRDIAELDK